MLDAQSRSSCDLSPGLSTISTGHHHQLVRFFMHHSSPPFGHKVHQCVAVPQVMSLAAFAYTSFMLPTALHLHLEAFIFFPPAVYSFIIHQRVVSTPQFS